VPSSAICSAYEDGDLVFCSELGRPAQPKWLTKRFTALRVAAGIPTGSLHILRHTAATLALTANPPVPLHIVAARLGDDPTILARRVRAPTATLGRAGLGNARHGSR
jgi:integrase